MIGKVFEAAGEILEDPLGRRLVLAALLPNVLVAGFKFADLDYQHSFFWTAFLGPYWFFEKTIFWILVVIASLDTLEFVAKQILELIERREEKLKEEAREVRAERNSERVATARTIDPQVPTQLISVPVKPRAQEPKVQPEVPRRRKLTAQEVEEKALQDFIGGGR